MSTNILHLPTYKVRNVNNTEHDYHVYAEIADPPVTCRHCHSVEIVRYGRRKQLVRDLRVYGKRVGIYVDTRRYMCKSCDRTFYESLPDTDEKRMMTSRLVKWIGEQSIKRPFSHIAEEVGINEMTVKNVFRDYINELEKTVRFETPKWLGIDEIHLIRPRCVISNIQNNTLIEILHNKDKKTLTSYLNRLEGRDSVRCVSMDMWNPYKDAVRLVLRNSIIVIDKFHVVRMANAALESARKSLREGLGDKQRRGLTHDRFILLKRRRDLKSEEHMLVETWTKNYPVLGEAYRLKEEFYNIYEASSVSDAKARYETWKMSITHETYEHFQPIITAWGNWNNEILNYFVHPITNAYTESLNNLIRLMSRLGRGYSFEALRAKLLFTKGAHSRSIPRPKFQRKSGMVGFSYMPAVDEWGRSIESDEREKNYGADISTLIHMIENGEL